MVSVAAIVPIFNGARHLSAFFDSLASALPPGSQVVLVDDASTEPVFDGVPEPLAGAGLIRLRNDRNLGYATSVNRGLNAAFADAFVILNTDLVLQPDSIIALLEMLTSTPNVGIVGSRLLYPTNDRVQHVGMAFGGFTQRHIYLDLHSDHPLTQRTREVQITTGAITAMTRSVHERLGPLDEQFFNNNEDIDYCLRARSAGLRNMVCAESVAHHWESHSGPARFARIESTEAAFWTRWGNEIEVDLARYVAEGLDHLLHIHPELEGLPFQVLDLSRSADDAIVLEQLHRRWPDLSIETSYRQMNNDASRLHLPLILPHWMQREPMPYLYLVDRHRELEENHLWFSRRRQLVAHEVIVDLHGVAMTTAEMTDRQ